MKYKIRNLIGILVVIAVLLIPVQSFADRYKGDDVGAPGQFNISVTLSDNEEEGYKNAIISVKNNGNDFSGKVRITFYADYSVSFSAEKTASISSGQTENVVIPVLVPVNFRPNNAKAKVEMVNSSGKTIAFDFVNDIMEQMGYKAGILSDRPGDLISLNGTSIYPPYGDEVTVVTETMTDAKDKDKLSEFSYIIINDYDSSVLSKEEINNIQNWVKNGGMLIIGTGNNEKTLAGFDKDFIDIEVLVDNYDKPVTAEIDYAQFAIDSEDTITYLQLVPGDSYLNTTYYSSSASVPMKTEGKGVVEVAQFSLSDDNFDQTWGMNQLLTDPVSATSKGNQLNGGFPGHNFEDLFGIMQGKGKVNTVLLRIIIVIYVALVGPGLYLVLKALKKREFIWLAIPALSIFFTLIIFLVGRGFSIKTKQFSNITVSEASGKGNTKSLMMGFNAQNKRWGADLSEDIKTAGLIYGEQYGSNGLVKTLVSYTPQGVSISYKPDAAFDAVYFTGISDNTAKGGIEADITLNDSISRISGKVTNNTGVRFDYILVVSDGYYKVIDTKGKTTVDFDEIAEQYTSFDDVFGYAKNEYLNDNFAKAAPLAALAYAASDIKSDSFVVGVTGNGMDCIKGNVSEKTYSCYYTVVN